MRAAEWLDHYGVTFDWPADGFHGDADGWEHQRFTLLLSASGHTLTVPWRQGLGVSEDPTPDSTLWAIANDVQSGELSWPEFAAEYGYDEYDAPLSQYRSWEACRDLAEQFRSFTAGAGADMLPDFLTIEDES